MPGWIGVGQRLVSLYWCRPGKPAIIGHREGYFVEAAETLIIGSDGSGHRVAGIKLAFESILHIGLIQGKFDGRIEGKRVLFGFDALDELEPVHGTGTMSPLCGRMEFRLTLFL